MAQPQRPSAAQPRLRAWQRAALQAYEAQSPRRDYLVTATPGAGKTTFALALAQRLLARRAIDRVVVVCPTDHLRTQWADAADRAGLGLDAALSNSVGPVRPDLAGYVTTYAQVAAKPALHAARVGARRTLVVLDEVHHAGDGLSWGEAVAGAFESAARRAVPDRDAVSHPPGRADPVRALRPGRRGRLVQPGRLHLRLRRGAARRRRAPGRVRRVHRHVALAQQRRRGDRRVPVRIGHEAHRGHGLAHRAEPEGPVGLARHRGDGRADHPPARVRDARRGRTGAGQRPGRRPCLCRDRRAGHRAPPGPDPVRRPEGE